MSQYTSIICYLNSCTPNLIVLVLLPKLTTKVFYNVVHSMKQTLEKHLLVDISAIREMVERNEIIVTWINKEKQLTDVLKKSGAPSNSMLQTLNRSKMIEL